MAQKKSLFSFFHLNHPPHLSLTSLIRQFIDELNYGRPHCVSYTESFSSTQTQIFIRCIHKIMIFFFRVHDFTNNICILLMIGNVLWERSCLLDVLELYTHRSDSGIDQLLLVEIRSRKSIDLESGRMSSDTNNFIIAFILQPDRYPIQKIKLPEYYTMRPSISYMEIAEEMLRSGQESVRDFVNSIFVVDLIISANVRSQSLIVNCRFIQSKHCVYAKIRDKKQNWANKPKKKK